MKLLRQALIEGSYLLDLDARNIRSIFHQTLDHVVKRGLLPAERRLEVENALLAREDAAASAIGRAVAIPHVYLDFFTEPVIVFVRLDRPLNLGAPDGIPTRFLFVLLGPTGRAAEHLDTLTQVARLMSDDEFRYDARVAESHHELLAALDRFAARMAPPLAVERAPSEALSHTGRLFGGLLKDVRRRLPHYAADFRDGLHRKSISSTLFLFFACLAPAVTFGGIMAELTDNHIGVVEMIVASAGCGVVYALVAGQPLIILGGTGPLLIFTVILFNLCEDMSLPFLETRACVGLWTGLLLLVLAATDASCLMRFFTRFTDEIFAALISIIFVFAAVHAIGEIFVDVYAEETTSHDKALVPLILAIGTFYIAMVLSRFRRSRYLLPYMREFLSDFGPAIALAVMTLVALWFKDVDLTVLPVPDSIRPTIDRPWLINPFSLPGWVWLASLAPAVLVTV
ncbi:MAG: PTS sugar transporter subunit IIA, partial [Planctomycetota bacterium]|nr:PTS sugar transporter subunit IIA [Planctomycetota bacterium]